MSCVWFGFRKHHSSSISLSNTEPAAPPQNVTTMAMLSTEILVTWEEVPAIDQNGIITMYEVEFMPLETFGDQIATNSVNITDPTMFNINLTGLEEYVEYNISVRAYTVIGSGPYSDPVTRRTLEDRKKNMIMVHGTLMFSVTQNLPLLH